MANRSRTSRSKPAATDAPWPRDFVVTDRAGPRVNGRRVKRGDTVTLGELEAGHELRIGAIAPAEPTVPQETE